MSNKIILSYSTLNDLYKWRHSWLNKLMGLPKRKYAPFEEGKEIHRVLLDHMGGIKLDERISKREKEDKRFQLPKLTVIEKVDFDPDTKRYIEIDDKYALVTFIDGSNLPELVVEIKSSNTAWTLGKFRDLMQRKIYSIAYPEAKRTVLVSSGRRLLMPGWQYTIKVFSTDHSKADKDEAMGWIKSGIAIIEKGDFEPDEKELELIKDPYNKCWYENCPWCNN